MGVIKLDEQQDKAINFLIYHIKNKTKTCCLLGAGGTGKTSIIHKIKNEIDVDTELVFTATTNKAASIMRKDIPNAITMHSAVTTHISTKLYKELKSYFVNKGIDEINDLEIELNSEVLGFLKSKDETQKDLLSNYDDVDSFFRSNGVNGYDPLIFSHYMTSKYIGGVCVVDEASMIPEKSIYSKDDEGDLKLQTIGVDVLNRIYDTVILVGDGMQLPPINGVSSFNGKPQFHLEKNYRSEKDLLRLLKYAREGKSLELFVPGKNENIRVINSISEQMYKDSINPELDIVHIVYKNNTRRDITKKIRGLDSQPKDDEPIVYYGANINDPGDTIAKNEIGVYKDGYGEWDTHRQVVSARNFDEYNTNPKVFSFLRYGYALTCHSAQGSSFDYVVIHLYDIPGFIDIETQNKWCYTACSRARKGVILVR